MRSSKRIELKVGELCNENRTMEAREYNSTRKKTEERILEHSNENKTKERRMSS